MEGGEFRAQAPLIIKVHKRTFASLGDAGDEQSVEPPKILCDPFGKPVFYGRLIAGSDLPTREVGFDAGRAPGFDRLRSKDASPDALRVEALLQDIRVPTSLAGHVQPLFRMSALKGLELRPLSPGRPQHPRPS